MNDQKTLTCPKCGHQDDEEQWDCLGACNDNVFCRRCHCEFDPETGAIHRCQVDAAQASINREHGIVCEGETA